MSGKRWMAVLLAVGVGLCLVLLMGGCGYTMARWAMGVEPFTHKYDHTEAVWVSMRDEKRLATQIHLPKGAGPWPTILIRNPYNEFDWFGYICNFFVRYGYACVHQDVRGRLTSEGDWNPLMNERDDGLDTLDWLVKQPFQNGNIALFGMSYLGATQWMVADTLPKEVKTFIPMVIATDMSEVLYERGEWRPEVFTLWASLMPGNELNYRGGGDYQAAIRHWPQVEIDELYFGRRLEWLRLWQASPDMSKSLWTQPAFAALKSFPQNVKVPVLMIGAWFDLFTKPQFADYLALATRSDSKFIVGPWSHLQRPAGDRPSPGDPAMPGELEVILDWLNHHLKGETLKHGKGFLQLYEMGAGEWHRYETWPPKTENLKYFLHGDSTSDNCFQGALSSRPPLPSEVSYTYDPKNPVPSKGGGPLLAFAIPGFDGVQPGSVRQPRVCAREDVISFLSEPLAEDLRLVGSIKVHLNVRSDAEDTAFTAKLSEVTDRGAAYNIRDSITTLAYRDSIREAQSYTPGDTVPVVIELWPIAWKVRKGYSLRLDISSSNFPAYQPHANRAGLWALQSDPYIATQTLVLGGEEPAYLELPLRQEPDPALTFEGEPMNEASASRR